MSQGNRRIGTGCLVFLGAGTAFGLALFVVCCVLVMAFWSVDLEWGPGVAVLEIVGELTDEAGVLGELDDLVEDPSTKALVVRVNSPGGDIAVAEEVFNALKRVREEKGLPVVASMGATAASGGYFLCCAAERIFANNSSLTGSIGVLVEYPNAQAFLDKVGVGFETVKSGEFKDTGAFSRPLTERERERVQEVVDDYHAQFVSLVGNERPLAADNVQELADGRVFTGRQALELGLVDEIGDLKQAVRYAGKRAGIAGEPRIIRAKESPISVLSLMERFGAAMARTKRGWTPKYVLR